MTSRMKMTLKIYCLTLIASTGLAWTLSYPLYDPTVRFSDLLDYLQKIHHISDGAAALMTGDPKFYYGPSATWIYAFFILPFEYPVIPYLVFGGLASLGGILMIIQGLGKERSTLSIAAVILTFLCSYPILYCLDRGNIEIVGATLCACGLVAFIRRSNHASAILFGIAISVKPFPVLFLYLFLRRKLYWDMIVAFATYLVANLVSLYYIGPSIWIAYKALRVASTMFFTDYVTKYHGYQSSFDHSLFSCFKRLARPFFAGESLERVLSKAFWVYFVFSLAIAGLSAAYFWRRPTLNQLFAIVILMVFLPPVSFDYTLIALLLLWGTYLIHMVQDGARFPLLFLIPLALLMTPQNYLHFGIAAAFGGQLKAVLLLILLVAAARIDLPSKLFGDAIPDRVASSFT